MPSDALAYFNDPDGRSFAYRTKTEFFSTRKGTADAAEKVGTIRDDKLYDLHGAFVEWTLPKLVALCRRGKWPCHSDFSCASFLLGSFGARRLGSNASTCER
jgi:hypothetical protein